MDASEYRIYMDIPMGKWWCLPQAFFGVPNFQTQISEALLALIVSGYRDDLRYLTWNCCSSCKWIQYIYIYTHWHITILLGVFSPNLLAFFLVKQPFVTSTAPPSSPFWHSWSLLRKPFDHDEKFSCLMVTSLSWWLNQLMFDEKNWCANSEAILTFDE